MNTTSTDAPSANSEKNAHPHRISVTDAQEKYDVEFPFTVAAPSFVIPAGAAENSRFLADYFPEVGLLFFETESCLAYSDFDLPIGLAGLPISWHVHLPLDLPWHLGLDMVWSKLIMLMNKAAYLSPNSWVLHPPTEPNMLVPLAERFHDMGIDPATILLENVDETDLGALWDEAQAGGYSTCLDLGHILAYGQHSLLDLPGLWKSVKMLHIYAPLQNGRHVGLEHLDTEGQTILRQMLENFRGDVLNLEVFNEREIFQSLKLLAKWTAQWSEKK